ncbi:MAG: ERCC4 domain-containing protein [Candidatus Micrarchaeia archaeon]|jgi:Fanconi anemia group M protein
MDELVFGESDKPIVFVDDRELKSACAKKLFLLGAVLLPKRLSVADFVVSRRVGLERKAFGDFEASIIDGRLFVQAGELAGNFERPLIAVVGGGEGRVHGKALRGAVVSLVVDYGVPVLFFGDDEELAEFIFHVAEREQLKQPREARVRVAKKASSLEELQRFVVEGLPGVGPVAAKRLLEHFGSVQGVFEADEDELQEVEGIGEEKAKEIRRVVSSRYAASD